MPVKVALTDVFPTNLYPVIAAAVPPGWVHEVATEPSETNRLRMISESDVVMSGGAITTDEMLRAAPKLTFVQKTGAGYNNISLELCQELGIGLCNLPGNNAPAVAEHTVLLILAVYRHLAELDARIRRGGWAREETRGSHRELRGKVVGIVGLGHIGREVATRLRGFGVSIIYSDVTRQPPAVEQALGARYVSLDELLEQADIVTLHTPLFPETREFIDKATLLAMKPDAVLINCGRGALVNEADLVEVLHSGHLYGAGLDCTAQEREDGTRAFWDLPNVVLSPHIAGSSIENFATMMSRGFANAVSYLAGQPLPPGDVIWLPPHRRH